MENLNRSGSYSNSSFVGAHDVLLVRLISSLSSLSSRVFYVKNVLNFPCN